MLRWKRVLSWKQSQKGQVHPSESVRSRSSSRHSSVVIKLKFIKEKQSIEEEASIAELLTEVRFLERQTAEFKVQNLKVEEQYAMSGARVKVLEDLDGDSVYSAISCDSKINIAWNPVNNRSIESGMMPARKGDMTKKFEAHQQNLEAHQAPVMSFHDGRIDDKCSDIKSIIISAEPVYILSKF